MTWVEELERLEKAATPGPWRTSYRGDGSGSVYEGDDELGDAALLDDANCPYIRGEVRYEDGDLSVALRNNASRLLVIARAAEAYHEATEAYILRLRQALYAGSPDVRDEAHRSIDALDLAGKKETASGNLRAALDGAKEKV